MANPVHGAPEFSGFSAWLRAHRVPVLAGLALVLVGAACYAVARHVQEEADRKGLSALAAAVAPTLRTFEPPATLPAELAKVRQAHRDSAVTGMTSLIYEFNIQKTLGDFAAAADTARLYLEQYPSTAFAPSMRLALVKLLAVPGQVDAAREQLRLLQIGLPPELEPDVALLRGQVELVAAEAARDRPDDAKTHLEAARDYFTRCVEQGRARYWPTTVVTVAQFELTQAQDRLAGHEPLPPAAPSTSAAPGGIEVGTKAEAAPSAEAGVAPGADADHDPDDGEDHTGHNHP